jgi:hypothetical protein
MDSQKYDINLIIHFLISILTYKILTQMLNNKNIIMIITIINERI